MAGGSLRRLLLAASLVCAVVLLSGCGRGNGQSTLSPESDQSRKIVHLWWGMLAAAGVVFGGAVALLVIAWVRRNREGLPGAGKNDNVATGLVVAFGIFVPVVCLAILFFVADIGVVRATDAPQPGQTKLTIDVVGHQWFWEVRYPGTRAVTANEIHIPVKTPVKVVATTADVIHSFWVPELNKKIDTIPGQNNSVELYADKVGFYRGQCAEFCGLQHAHMAMAVYADPPAKFRAWLANMSRPLPQPANPQAKAGEQDFLSLQCASCHTLRGTTANGRIGPDLTHLATRRTLAALTITNTRTDLTNWIRDPQHVKPGNKMPGLNLTGRQLQQLVTFLEGLR
ncbi:MAG TPA: cytochrome c oxidase subunit II [Thermoleophilaceae bacterium]